MTKPALVCFDFDGTLADTWPVFRDVFEIVAARFALRAPTDAEVAQLRAMRTRAVMAWLGVSPVQLPAILRVARAQMAERATDIALVPGMAALLEALHARGVSVAVVSSNGEALVRQVLGPRLAAKVAAYRCGVGVFGKASRLRGVCRALRVSAAQSAFVGDEPRDVEAAQAAGLRMLAVGWGYAAPSALEGADGFCETVDALGAALGVTPSMGARN